MERAPSGLLKQVNKEVFHKKDNGSTEYLIILSKRYFEYIEQIGYSAVVMKSERLKKLELELQDLEQWLNLGLVPKKDIEKHKGEIEILKSRVEEEKHRLQSIKENGDNEEYSVPKRNQQQRAAYQEPHTLPGIDLEESGGGGMTDSGVENDSPTTFGTETETVADDEEPATTISEDEDEEDPYSDKNRWRRGILEDPDGDSW